MVVAVLTASTFIAQAKGGRAGSEGVIYVTGQDLYYDTFTPISQEKGLPIHGPFQKLNPNTSPPSTMYGPGDTGYYGGRWWIDVNGDNEQDEGDIYFLCPLLGPGREEP